MTALPRHDAWTLFSADTTARLDQRLLSGALSLLFGGNLRITPSKDFSAAAVPNADRGVLWLRLPALDEVSLGLRLFPIERAPALREAALEVATAMGGMGMDALLLRARKVVQLETTLCNGPSLVAAALFSQAFLAVILPPAEDRLFAIKGARDRLAALDP